MSPYQVSDAMIHAAATDDPDAFMEAFEDLSELETEQQVEVTAYLARLAFRALQQRGLYN